MKAYVAKKSSNWGLQVLINNDVEAFISFLHTILRDVYVERYGKKHNKYYIQIDGKEYDDVLLRYNHGDAKVKDLVDSYLDTLPVFSEGNWGQSTNYRISRLADFCKSKTVDFNEKINIYWE